MIKLHRIISFLFIIALLTSCLNYQQTTTIKTDNSGKMHVHYWMQMNPDLDSLLIKKLGLFNEDSLSNSFTSLNTKLRFSSVYNDFKDSTLHAQVEFEFNNFDSLNNLRFFRHSELSIKDGPDGIKIFSQFIQPITSGFGIENTSIEIKYIYYLPGEIINHNANSLSRNKLTWIFSLNNIGSGKTISANYIPFRLKETPKSIYILSGIVIIIVLVFLLRKKKN